MAITISGSGITSANIADGTITTDDILASDVKNLKSGRKNLIINGGFDVWQRGTSFSFNNETKYTSDRWLVSHGGTGTMSQQSFTPGQTDVPGEPTYYMRLNNSGATSKPDFIQRVEDVRTTASKTLTLSFWAKASTALTNEFYVHQRFGSGGSAEVGTVLGSVSIGTSWAKHSITFTMPSISGKTIGAGSYAQLFCVRVLSGFVSGVTLDITGVQLELGSVATDFEHRSYGEELALCQRYYHRVGTASSSYNYVATGGFTGGSTEIVAFVYHPVEMRVVPSLGIDSLTNMEFRMDNDTSFTMMSYTPGTSQSSTKTAGLWFGGQNTVGLGKSGFIRVRNGLSGWFSFDAEL